MIKIAQSAEIKYKSYTTLRHRKMIHVSDNSDLEFPGNIRVNLGRFLFFGYMLNVCDDNVIFKIHVDDV